MVSRERKTVDQNPLCGWQNNKETNHVSLANTTFSPVHSAACHSNFHIHKTQFSSSLNLYKSILDQVTANYFGSSAMKNLQANFFRSECNLEKDWNKILHKSITLFVLRLACMKWLSTLLEEVSYELQ